MNASRIYREVSRLRRVAAPHFTRLRSSARLEYSDRVIQPLCTKMNDSALALLAKHNLTSFRDLIESYSKPAIGFSLSRFETPPATGVSRVGGCPDVPLDFNWPENQGRRLDFLLQVNLSDLSSNPTFTFPGKGIMSFFYDVQEQPWGFDPKDLNGFRVLHFPDIDSLRRTEEDPDNEFEYPDSQMNFYVFDLSLIHI